MSVVESATGRARRRCQNCPGPAEIVDATPSQTITGAVVLSGIDQRFDRRALALLEAVAAGEMQVVVISALSRFSRDSRKLLRMLEFVLAHGASVLTTNFLFPVARWRDLGPARRPGQAGIGRALRRSTSDQGIDRDTASSPPAYWPRRLRKTPRQYPGTTASSRSGLSRKHPRMVSVFVRYCQRGQADGLGRMLRCRRGGLPWAAILP